MQKKMNNNKIIQCSLDKNQDVLYIKYRDILSHHGKEAPHDGYLILNYAEDGSVVGLQILDATKITWNEWIQHPDRSLIPSDILQVIDRWVLML
jgi:uncharacterized protein YuzE